MKRLTASSCVRRLTCFALALTLTAATPFERVSALGTTARTDMGSSPHCTQHSMPCPARGSISCCCDAAPSTPASTPASLRIGLADGPGVVLHRDLAFPVATFAGAPVREHARVARLKVPLTVFLSTFLI